MTGVNFATLIRLRAKANSTTFTDANIVSLANPIKDDMAGEIQKARPNIWRLRFLDSLVADQREYSFPANTINSFESLEVFFTSGDDFIKAEKLQRPPDHSLDEQVIVANYSNESPKYFTYNKKYYILSGTITSVSNSIQIFGNIFPADIAASETSALLGLNDTDGLEVDPSTTTHGFPREFHELWADKIVNEWLYLKDKITEAEHERRILKWQANFDLKLEAFSEDVQDGEVIPVVQSHSNFFDNGFNT